MPQDPYATGLLPESPYWDKSDVVGKLVTVLDWEARGRGLELIAPHSRCAGRGEIHELLVAKGDSAGPGKGIEDAWYLGFVEIERGGVLLHGDEVRIGGRAIGTLAGFDLTHFPNHLNIALKSPEPATGVQHGLRVGDTVVFSFPQRPNRRPKEGRSLVEDADPFIQERRALD